MRGLRERLRDPALAAPAAMFVIALVLRAVVVLATPGYDPISDSLDYHRHAVSIAAGQGYPVTPFGLDGGGSAFRPPLYPYLLGWVYGLSGSTLTPARLVGALLGAITVVLVYMVARRLWGRREALVAGAIATVFPGLVLISALQTELLFLPLELGAVLAVLAFRESGALRWAAAAGALCGLAALTRSNGALFVLAAGLGVWTVRRPLLSARAFVAPALVALAAALVIAPWAIRNSIEFGQFVPVNTQTGFALAGTYNDQARANDEYPATWILPASTRMYGSLYSRRDINEGELDSRVRSKALDYAFDHPGYIAESTFFNTLRMFELAPAEPGLYRTDREQQNLGRDTARVVRWSAYLLLLLAIAGVVTLVLRSPERRGPLFLWLFPVLALSGAVAILGLTRYRAPVYPFLILLAAVALVDLDDRLRRRRVAG